MGQNIRITSGPAIEKAGDLASILTNLSDGDVLFIDEIHRLSPLRGGSALSCHGGLRAGYHDRQGTHGAQHSAGPAALYPGGRHHAGGAFERAAARPLRHLFRLEMYSPEELAAIVRRSAGILNVHADDEGILEIARRSRGTPRIANRMLRRVRDFAQIRAGGVITLEVARQGMDLLDVDELGLEKLDRAMLETMIDKFGGGPVGLETLSAMTGEDASTIEDVYEPYLIAAGLSHTHAQRPVWSCPPLMNTWGASRRRRPTRGNSCVYENQRF